MSGDKCEFVLWPVIDGELFDRCTNCGRAALAVVLQVASLLGSGPWFNIRARKTACQSCRHARCLSPRQADVAFKILYPSLVG